MQFDCIRVLPVLILALIAAFGRCDPRDAEFNKTAALNCRVNGSSIVGRDEENPDYCWAFAYYMENNTEYPNESDPNKSHPKCCETAETNDDIPKDNALKEFVKIEEDGIHILYGKYLEEAAKDNHSGLLVPMLTLRNKMLIFKLKFSDDKCVDFNKKDNGGDTGLDNGNRIAGNMIHFSYINTADTNKMANNLGKRWEEMNGTFKQSYMTECHFCDEYLYLPIRANGTAYEFHIFYEGTQHGYRLGFNSWIGDYYNIFFYPAGTLIPKNEFDESPFVNAQRIFRFCPVELRKWAKPFKLGNKDWDVFYLPFRLLYPAFSTFLAQPYSDGKITMINEKKGCDYELIFNSTYYRLLVPQKEKTRRRRSFSAIELGDEEHSSAISGL